ncbi:MAG: hypothetical protein IPI62_14925 [Bacteroidetes bacterium]|nr:hypothetical protein [Bacteroidota bacterium]
MSNTVSVSATSATTYYADTDGDGFGNPAAPTFLCSTTAGFVLNNTDCNDAASSAYPGGTEICNGIDDDCDNYIDEGCGTPIYCIGPSASYIPPSGPSYVNQFSPFPSVKAAVTFLNSYSPTQHVIFELQNNYSDAGETFPITITYQGNASATAVFRPRSDVSSLLTISGIGVGSTSGLIEFSNADYVTFDGSPGGVQGSTSNLRIRNTTTGNANANFYFTNDATNNIINAITIEGGKNSYHCIFFGYSPGTTGNDFNTVQNCLISNRTDLVTTQPQIAIHSSSLATGAAANSDNTIAGNKIVNIGDGVKLDLNGNAGSWIISNNHFYFTDNAAAFKISEAISITSIENLFATISSNYIGGTAPFAGGSPLNETSSTIGTVGIYVNIMNAISKSTISGNVIKNMQRNSTGTGSFTGIAVQSGPADIINNVIGDPLVANDLTFGVNGDILFQGITSVTAQNLFAVSISGNSLNNISMLNTFGNNGQFVGLNYSNTTTSNGTATISNNIIQAVSFSNYNSFTCLHVSPSEIAAVPVTVSNNKFDNIILSNVNGGSFKGINCDHGNVIISGNRIGSFLNPNSITIASPVTQYGIYTNFSISGNCLISNDTISNLSLTNSSSGTKFYAIYSNSNGSTINQVIGNRIYNISSASEMSGLVDDAITGIGYFCNATNGLSVSNNTITGLNATTNSSTANPKVLAISIYRTNGSGPISVSGNNIHSLTNTGADTETLPTIVGIRFINVQQSSSTVSNNMIAISNGTYTNGVNIFGIYDEINNGLVTNTKFYLHNSISISGNSSVYSQSAAFWQNATFAKLSLRNNILHNTRSSGSGFHYAIVHESGNANAWNATSSNYNDLYSIDVNTVGALPLATSLTFAGWKTATGGDNNSKNVPVSFINNSTDLHLNSANNCDLESTGTPVAGITTDFDGHTRNVSTPDIGADEFTAICATLVNLKAFIQGFYIGGGMMRSTINPALPTSDCDTLILQLAQSTSPYTILFTDTAILQTNGNAQFYFPAAVAGNSYFLVLKHRNALKVWSANALTLSNGFSFDFSTAANQAYSSNQKFLETNIYGFYSGDVNQDGTINSTDYSSIENATQNYTSGYYSFDLTGDHLIESADFSLIENNSMLLLNVAHP